MDSESKIQQFLLLGKNARGRSCAEIIAKATSEPGLFAFGELLDMPNVQELRGSDLAQHLTLLELFCYGTFEDYKAAQPGAFPDLNPQQILKLKQLTVVHLAANQRVLAYEMLRRQLDISNLRQLEDFLITDCFYAGLIKGKLDQRQACLIVHDVISRDVRKERLPELEVSIGNWLSTAQQLMKALEQKMSYTTGAVEDAKTRRQELEKKQEEMKRNLKAEMDIRSADAGGMMLDDALDMMEEDERRMPSTAMRPKRRR